MIQIGPLYNLMSNVCQNVLHVCPSCSSCQSCPSCPDAPTCATSPPCVYPEAPPATDTLTSMSINLTTI